MLNESIINLEQKNIFAKVTEKISEFRKKHPEADIVSLGIGDVSRPIPQTSIEAMHRAVDDLATMENFKGYGAYYGYDFLKEKILENDYRDFNFSKDEVYISNGAKTDTTSILELFDINSKICIADPMYPIYRDGARCLNRNIYVLEALEKNDFVLQIPKEKYDIIYICSPNNPIGIAYTYDDLKKWVDYALKNNSIILYDNVYESFITSNNVPHSIYEITGAKNVAIEFRSFSKKASFTGVRCSYYIIPNEIDNGINFAWKKRTINRFNGADYIAQRGAEATYTNEAKIEIKENIKYYMDNANSLRMCFKNLGFKVWGGIDSPFIWVKIKEGITSWEIFEKYLSDINVVIIPGVIFGINGDSYFRVSALGNNEVINKAIERLKKYYEKNN